MKKRTLLGIAAFLLITLSVSLGIILPKARSNKEKWSFQTGTIISFSPTIVKGIAYVGSNDGKLYALDALTGRKQWSFQTGDTITAAPAVANGMVYVGSDDTKLYAVQIPS